MIGVMWMSRFDGLEIGLIDVDGFKVKCGDIVTEASYVGKLKVVYVEGGDYGYFFGFGLANPENGEIVYESFDRVRVCNDS